MLAHFFLRDLDPGDVTRVLVSGVFWGSGVPESRVCRGPEHQNMAKLGTAAFYSSANLASPPVPVHCTRGLLDASTLLTRLSQPAPILRRHQYASHCEQSSCVWLLLSFDGMVPVASPTSVPRPVTP